MSEGWNVDTLKELMEAEFRATRDALAAVVHSQQLQNRAQEEAIKVASAANALALAEAKVGPQKQFDSLAVKIEDLMSRAGVPRGEMDALFASAASSRHSEIADAVGAVGKQFASDFDRLTKAVETQGDQFMKTIIERDEQRGAELKRLTTKVETIDSGVSDLNAIQLQRQGRSSGVSWTGKTVVSVVGVAVSIIVILGFLLAHPWRP